MHKPSSRTAYTNFSDEKSAASAWVTLLNNKGVEDRNDGMHPNMELTETPTEGEVSSKVDNVVLHNSETEAVVAAYIALTTY